MKTNFPIAFAIFFLFSASIFAQTVTPTPPALEDTDDVVRISTSLIQVDASITDKKGNPLTDLRQDEVEIYENGVKQDISNFSFVAGTRETIVETEEKKGGPPLPQRPVRPEQVRRTVALVVDDLSLSFNSVYWVKKALRTFVDEQMQDGDLVAIVRTAGGMGALQQFTTDKRLLRAAIEKVRFSMSGSAKVNVFTPISPSLLEELDKEGTADQIAAQRESERLADQYRETVFASGTLGALNFIIRGMKELPGRKSIMLLSDGFSLYTRNEQGMPEGSPIFDMLRRLTDLANRSSVVIYTMDARGLLHTHFEAMDNVSAAAANAGRVLNERENAYSDSRDGLKYLSYETGGFHDGLNDMNHAIDRVLKDQSYYLIGYQPDEDTFDPKTRRYNKLEIKVNRPGAEVRYRSGFFGFSESEVANPNITADQKLMNAVSSPFAVTEIPLSLSTLFIGDDTKNSLVRTILHINGINGTPVPSKEKDYKIEFDLLTLVYGDNGTIIDQSSKTYALTVNEETYKKIKSDGFVYNYTTPLKKAGAYQIRVAIRDTSNNKVGSANQFIEVPNLKKNDLTLSSIVLQNMPAQYWNADAKGVALPANISPNADPLRDTAIRQFKRGTVLRVGFDVYNAKSGGGKKADLMFQLKVFHDGKLFLEGKPATLDSGNTTSAIPVIGTIKLGFDMPTGDYIVQATISDRLAKRNRQTADQFVQFEIIE